VPSGPDLVASRESKLSTVQVPLVLRLIEPAVKIASSNGMIGSTNTSTVREELGFDTSMGTPTSSSASCGRRWRRL
jgi:hypothetical protein